MVGTGILFIHLMLLEAVARTPNATRSPNTSSLPEADSLPPKPLRSSADTALIGSDMDKLKTGWKEMQANLQDLLTGKEIPILSMNVPEETPQTIQNGKARNACIFKNRML